MTSLTQKTSQAGYWQFALRLAILKVFYNIAKGLISIFFGVSDESFEKAGGWNMTARVKTASSL